MYIILLILLCSNQLTKIMSEEDANFSLNAYSMYGEDEYVDEYDDYNITEDVISGCEDSDSCYEDYNLWSNNDRLDDNCGRQFICINISTFPDDVAPNTKYLSIQDGSFSSLTYDDLKNLTNLLRLFVLYNNLQSIQPGAFRSHAVLQVLRLNYNNLNEILKGTFIGLHSVTTVELIKSTIEQIYDGSFIGLSNVTDLSLNLNLITRLDNYVFRGLLSLKNLILQENNISFIAPFAFKNLTQLQTLNLKSNHLLSIPTKSLKIIPNLFNLFLGDNPITSIGRTSMKGLRSLKHLSLENCRIHSIATRAFNKKNIQTLVLERNQLTTFPNLGRMNRLRILSLSGNPWSCDRNAIPMLRWLIRHSITNELVRCASPPSKRGSNLLDFSDSDLEAEIPMTSLLHTTSPSTVVSANSTRNESYNIAFISTKSINNISHFVVTSIYTSNFASSEQSITTDITPSVTNSDMTENLSFHTSRNEEVSDWTINHDITSIYRDTSRTSTTIVSDVIKQPMTNKTKPTVNIGQKFKVSRPVIVAVIVIALIFILLIIIVAYKTNQRRGRRQFPQNRDQLEGNVSCGVGDKNAGNGILLRSNIFENKSKCNATKEQPVALTEKPMSNNSNPVENKPNSVKKSDGD